MKDAVSVVIIEGGGPSSEIEKMLVSVRQAIILDNIEKMKKVGSIGAVYLVTNYADLAEKAAVQGGVLLRQTKPGEEDFHIGRVLQNLINQEKLEHIVYLGGASFPFLTVEELEHVCLLLLGSRPVIYSNNVMSADIIAFTPGNLINRITPPGQDNILAVALRDGTGIEHRLLKTSTGLLFDVDTPADLLILAGSPFTGPQAREALSALNLDLRRLERVKEVLKGDYEDVLLLGRVGAPIIAKINKNWKVRLRVFSEERGMKALGREKRGEALSLLGFFLQEVGPQRFIKYIERVCRAAFLDTRVLMAHLRPGLSSEERYLSDLGHWQEMKEPFFRDLTRCAMNSEIPILLGGHSLILGGLWALLEEIGPTYFY